MKIGTIIGALVGGIVMFFLGFLAFAVLFTDYFRSNMIVYPQLEKNPPEFLAIFIFNVAWAAVIAFALDFAGRRSWAEGAKVGAIVMCLVAIGVNSELYAFMNLHKTPGPMVFHVLILIVMGTIAGAAIGLVMGLVGRKSSTVRESM